MNRKTFLRYSSLAAASALVSPSLIAGPEKEKTLRPLAITMWDFSWLERRWPGAGYEDWDAVLDELLLRGYNAVRIDAYPHLVANNPAKEYTLLPVWTVQDWGSPALNKVQVQPALNQFIAKCKARGIRVGLSCWYRQDTEKILMNITSPQKMADNWIATLHTIEKAGLLDAVLYVDLCNEWPGDAWAPFFKNNPEWKTWGYWYLSNSTAFMQASIAAVRKAFPGIPLCYSFTGGDPALYTQYPLPYFDLLEHHIWMAQQNGDEFYKEVGYKYERFTPDGYNNLTANYEKAYRARPRYWQGLLKEGITKLAAGAGAAKQPLITTECWGLVDFKDWPLLQWDIVKELCELGVQTAAATGQWLAVATSNFCAPQFRGMWRDVAWHQRLTKLIKEAPVNEALKDSVLGKRIAGG